MLLPKQVLVLVQVKTSNASKNVLSKARWTVSCLYRATNLKKCTQESIFIFHEKQKFK